MSLNLVGAYVMHAKLPELGSGEVLSSDKGTLRVRFASGERLFLTDVVQPHLTVTAEGPAPAAAKGAAKKRKAPTKKAAKSVAQ